MTKESYAGNRKKRFLFYGLMVLCALIVGILQFFGPGKSSDGVFPKVRLFYQGDICMAKA